MTRTAIIIGGGIAGPLSALALARVGIGATVYEAYPEPAFQTGSWLTVAVNGLQALCTLGLHEAVKAAGFPAEHIEFASGNGKHLGSVPLGGRLADGTVTHTLKRADLLRAIYEGASRAGVEIVYGKRLASAENTASGVVARFADGTEVSADFLIGADGVHSQLRRIIDPAAPRPTYSQLLNFGGFTPSGKVPLQPGAYHMLFGTRGFFGYTVAPSGEVWWFVNLPERRELPRDELAGVDWRARLTEVFSGDAGPMCALLQATPEAIEAFNTYELECVPRWQRGRMLIIGDAAHAASPSTGQGASMAAEDAVALAASLREHGDIEATLAAFVAARKPRAQKVVAYGKRSANMKLVGPVGRFFRDLILPTIFKLQSRPTSASSMAWLFDHRIELT